MAQNVTQYCHVCKTQTTSGLPVVFLQSFAAQLSGQPVTYFGLFMKCHNFTTTLLLNHFVHHEISQLFVTILVQNTELYHG